MVMMCIGAPLRVEGSNTGFNTQPPLLEHAPKHGVVVQPKVILPHFESNMAIAEVIGSLEEIQRFDRAHMEQGLAGGSHADTDRLEFIGETITGHENTVTGKLQQEISATSC